MKKQNGITLIALIITIIVMLILVGVTINVALNGGLFNTADDATTKTEKHAIYDQIVGAMKLNNNGNIKVKETFDDVVNMFGEDKINPTTVEEDSTEVIFTVTGKRGTYKYKITGTEISIEGEDSDIQNPEPDDPEPDDPESGIGEDEIAFETFYNGEQFILESTDEGYDSTQIHLGDFVNYPVTYTKHEDLSTSNEWVVIGYENGGLKLMSTGMPVAVAWGNNTLASPKITDWTIVSNAEGFCNNSVFYEGVKINHHYCLPGSGNPAADLSEYVINGNKFYNQNFAADIRVMNLNDISQIEGHELSSGDTITSDLIKGTRYYIGTAFAGSETYEINSEGKLSNYDGGLGLQILNGVKIVVVLKPEVLTTGKVNNVWQIYNK